MNVFYYGMLASVIVVVVMAIGCYFANTTFVKNTIKFFNACMIPFKMVAIFWIVVAEMVFGRPSDDRFL